jgi:DUF4097 and DUF4098 domain-containing protein YvlB
MTDLFRMLCAVIVAGIGLAATQLTGDLCADRNYSSRDVWHCEVRETTLTGVAALDVDPGRHGGVHIRGWSGQGTRLRTRVEGHAATDTRAREIAAGVRVTTVDGRLRSDGPTTWAGEHWSSTFFLDVPATTHLAVNTENGGISIEEFRGDVVMHARNGGIHLRSVGGRILGRAQNGGLRIELDGQRWEGSGLDVETRNGGVRITLPAAYSAELETGTVNGRVDIDVPRPMVIHAGRVRVYTAILGGGGAKIRAVTTNGGVVVRTQ